MKFLFSIVILFLSGQVSAQVKQSLPNKNHLSNQYKAKSDQLLQATRFLNTQKNTTNEIKKERAQLVDELKHNQPNSALYYFNAFLVSGRANASYDLLQKAYRKAPFDITIVREMAGYSARNKNHKELIDKLKKLMNLDVLTANLSNYFVDLFNATPQNGVLVFHGFDDSYNALYVQQVLGVRKDIQIINLEWFTIKDYRLTLENDGFNIPESKIVNPTFLRDFIAMNPRKKIGISLTLPSVYLVKLPSEVNLIVTAYWTHTEVKNIDPMAMKFLHDKPSGEKSVKWSKNYLLYLNQMREKYRKQGNKSESKRYADKMKLIGAWNDITNQINKILAQ